MSFALQGTVTNQAGQVIAQGLITQPNEAASEAQAMLQQIIDNGLNSVQLVDGSKVHIVGEVLTAQSLLTFEVIAL